MPNELFVLGKKSPKTLNVAVTCMENPQVEENPSVWETKLGQLFGSGETPLGNNFRSKSY